MSSKLVAAFRDLTDRKDVVFHGPGSFVIGLTSDGSITVEPEENTDAVCVILLTLGVGFSGGYVLAPANYDLPCMVNESEELAGEINLIDGTRLEVANKTLVFIDGPIPVRRRKLPRTPGLPLEDGPPVKPSRAQASENQEQDPRSSKTYQEDEGTNSNDDGDDDSGDRRWLETSWCMLDMPTAEQQLFTDLKTPEQISIVAASYFCKQLRLFTDAVLTSQLLDDVFKLFKDSIAISKEIFLDYLSDISQIIQKNPQRSQTRPMHGPAIKLLNSLIKQSLEPLSRVILLLDLMRTFSHFDSNMATMARHQVAATVVGCMSVYCDVVEVQAYGLDTLAKVAKFRPAIDKKAPLREGAIQIMLKSEEKHHKGLTICRSLCRVLANLADSLIDVTNSLLDRESANKKAVSDAVERYEECLLFMFKQSLPVIQTILDDHGTDLGVRTEGRKFVYYYAKLPQLQQKKKTWLQTLQKEEETIIEITDESNTSAPDIHDLRAYQEDEAEPKGILKKVGSFENLRDPGKRIMFADYTVGGSASDSSSSDDDDMFEGPFGEPKIPTEIEPDEQFQQDLMKAFIGKTRHWANDSDDSSDSSEDDSFLAKKSKRHKKKRPVKTVPVIESNGLKSEKNDVEMITHKAGTEVDVQRMETQAYEGLVVDTTKLDFVENHDRNSFNSGTKTVSTDDMNDRNLLENTQNNYKTEENRNLEIETTGICNNVYRAQNCLNESVQSRSHEQDTEATCRYDGESHDLRSEKERTLGDDDEFIMISRQDVTESAENRQIGAVNEENRATDRLQEEMNENELSLDIQDGASSNCDNFVDSNGAIIEPQEPDNVPCEKDERNERLQKGPEKPARSSANTLLDNCALDVPFMGKLVRTQIITHVGSLVFQGDDSKVLLVIDQPIAELLEHAGAPAALIEFSRNQYGGDMTLMDLEPSIVISAIDAVRYRSVTADLVQKAVLSLTRAITHKLQPYTVNITMLFYKGLFADENMKSIVTEKEFVQEFKMCFSNATERLNTSHNIEEIRAKLASPSFVV